MALPRESLTPMTRPELHTLTLQVEQHVAHVQLARPDHANAMSRRLWQELGELFRWLDGTPAVRVIVLSGQGRHFCAGMDRQVFSELIAEEAWDAEVLRLLILQFQEALNVVERCRKPVLAAIHGACLGGGLALAACCDARYVAADSRFAIREINLGMTADTGALQRLPHLMPRGLVHELAYTGRDMDAAEALRCGLANHLELDLAAVIQHVNRVARHIAAQAPAAVRGTKQSLLHGRDHRVADSLDQVATWNAGMLRVEDIRRALSATPDHPAEFDD